MGQRRHCFFILVGNLSWISRERKSHLCSFRSSREEPFPCKSQIRRYTRFPIRFEEMIRFVSWVKLIEIYMKVRILKLKLTYGCGVVVTLQQAVKMTSSPSSRKFRDELPTESCFCPFHVSSSKQPSDSSC